MAGASSLEELQRESDAWVAAMRRGHFARAWELSDLVLRRRAGRSASNLPRHLRWLWDGTPLAGRRVLVRSYHGLGDTLQFVRFVPLLAGIAHSVALEVQPELLPLLTRVPRIDRLLAPSCEVPETDLEIELMELPHALRVTLETLPRATPYLALARAARPALQLPPPLSGQRRVGIVWAAGDWRSERSLPPGCLAPLGSIPGVEFVSLQHGDAAKRLPPLDFLARQAPDAPVLSTAALLSQLDLVITVDTMAAHLAGALGRPVWTLLDADADWRWMERREDSPWYPTMRLFRQPHAGAWEPVVQRAAAALPSVVRDQPPPRLPAFSVKEIG